MAKVRHDLLVNETEAQLRQMLKEIKWWYIAPKVRLADVLNDKDADWTKEERLFMLHSHFDFVLAHDNKRLQPFAGVELDGPSHETAEARRRDIKKTALCKKADFPLFRFGYHHLQDSLGESWVQYLLDLWQRDSHNQQIQTAEEEIMPAQPKKLWLLLVKAHKSGLVKVLGEAVRYRSGNDPVKGHWAECKEKVVLRNGQEFIGTGYFYQVFSPLPEWFIDNVASDLALMNALEQVFRISNEELKRWKRWGDFFFTADQARKMFKDAQQLFGESEEGSSWEEFWEGLV
jgi:hypothetical protein